VKPSKKTRPEAVLKNLPDEFQAEIYAWLRMPPDKDGTRHSYEAGVAWLATKGVATSKTPLHEFFQWYPTALKLREARNFGQTFQDERLKLFGGDITPERLEQIRAETQLMFELRAAGADDQEFYAEMRKLAVADAKIALAKGDAARDDRRIALLEKKAALVDQLKAESAKPGGITPEVLARIEEAAKLL